MDAITDPYEKALAEKTDALRACQQRHGLKSCLPCPELDDCTLHEAYIEAVHSSMHKGASGGFEF